MNFLVLSRQHSLLPFAHRLQLEGHDVQTIVYNPGNKGKYEGAYAGVLKLSFYHGEKKRHKVLELFKEMARDSPDAIVLTNDHRAAKDFREAKTLFATLKEDKKPVGILRLGAWFDGKLLQAPHLLIVDEGLYPGGMGARGDAGMTLIQFRWKSNLTKLVGLEREELLAARKFRGLCQWGIDLTPEGELTLTDGIESGWPMLHTHAFVSELPAFGEVLSGAVPELPTKFTVVLPVTRPPWPYPVMHSPGQSIIEGLTDEQIGQVFWHDAAVDQKRRTISTAGLDGLVGVVRGAADSFELAQARALKLAATMRFPEKQFRPDVGGVVRQTLAVLEERFGVRV